MDFRKLAFTTWTYFGNYCSSSPISKNCVGAMESDLNAVARNFSQPFGLLGANALGQQRTYGYASLRPNARLRLAFRMSATVSCSLRA